MTKYRDAEVDQPLTPEEFYDGLTEGMRRVQRDLELMDSRQRRSALRYRLAPAALVFTGLLVHAACPRYEWRDPGGGNYRAFVKIDRWTGGAEFGAFTPEHGWLSEEEQRAIASFNRMMEEDARDNPLTAEEEAAGR